MGGSEDRGNLLREGKDGTTRTLAPPSNLLPLVYYHSLSACGDANASLSHVGVYELEHFS